MKTVATKALRQMVSHSTASKTWWLGALGSALCAFLFATSVQAQEGGSGGSIEEVLVTGSYIKSRLEDSPNPVSVLDREELFRQGSPAILDIIKDLAISSGVDGDTNQFQSNGLEGSANINLRGLGPGRTLVLLNGKRLPSAGVPIMQAGYQQFVNINFIPTVALGQIEFLKEGASAIYGSDAVAGVSNFATRNDLEGFEVSANHKLVENSAGWNELGVAFGHTFDNGGRLLLAAGYNSRGELEIRDRNYALRPYSENPRGGWSGLGNPARTVAVGAAGGSFIDPGCNDFVGVNGGVCRFQYTQYDNLIEDEERWQFFGEYSFDFDNGSQLTVAGLWGRVEVPEWKTSPSYPPAASFLSNVVPNNHSGFVQLVSDVNAGNYQNGQCAVSLAGATNPDARIWLANFDGALGSNCERAVVPTTQGTYNGFFVTGAEGNQSVQGVRYNVNEVGLGTATTGAPTQLFIGRFLGYGAIEPAEGRREHELWWLAADYDFSIGSADAYFSASYGTQDSDIVGGDMLTDRFTAALSGFGGADCTNYQAFVEASAAERRGMTPGGGCLQYNPFSNALPAAGRGPKAGIPNPNYEESVANSPELLDWLVEPTPSSLITELLVVDFVASNSFGAHDWAAGASFRNDRYERKYGGFNNRTNYPCQSEFQTDASECPGDSGVLAFLSPQTPSFIDENVVAGFGEIQWNFLDNRLQVQTAIRYEEYEESGDSLDPKVAARLDITDALTVRASYSTSFKAPQLAQVGLADDTSLSFIGPIGTFKAVDTSTTAQGLEPESAESINLGAVFQHGGFFASVDYWSISLEDPIVNESFDGIVAAVCPGNSCDPDHALAGRLIMTDSGADISGQPLSMASQNVALTAGSLNRVRVALVNEDKLEISGIDVNVRYTVGGLTLGAQWSRLEEYKLAAYDPVSDSIREVDYVGRLNTAGDSVRPLPEDKYKLYASYEFTTDIGDFVASAYIDVISDYEDERDNVEVDEYQTLDLNLLYTPNQGATTLFINLDNVMNEKPPLARLDLSYDSYTHSPIGRSIKIGVRHRFSY